MHNYVYTYKEKERDAYTNIPRSIRNVRTWRRLSNEHTWGAASGIVATAVVSDNRLSGVDPGNLEAIPRITNHVGMHPLQILIFKG